MSVRSNWTWVKGPLPALVPIFNAVLIGKDGADSRNINPMNQSIYLSRFYFIYVVSSQNSCILEAFIENKNVKKNE